MSSAVRLPKVNQRVWISLDGDVENNFPSRVESTDDNSVVVAAPLIVANKGNETELSVADAPSEDIAILLLWKNQAGFAKVSAVVRLVEEGILTLWTLEPVEEVETIQRRQFVRVPDNSLAQLHFSDHSIQVQLLDLSEGGLRALIPDFSLTIDHLHIYADLTIGGQQVLIPCKFIRKETNELGQTTIAVSFIKLENSHAETLRKHVFGQQVELKKAGTL